ncbi:hypothetical protein [Caballeronia temeraria]|uniref:hypothetical protein n=1 Tax=Caballeronia temeraria TaxID=1777137 RepID=UPI0012FE383D|nr:hypothetical protein [Caballeronia temeraria]
MERAIQVKALFISKVIQCSVINGRFKDGPAHYRVDGGANNRFQFHFRPLHAGPVNQIELWIADAGRAPAAR